MFFKSGSADIKKIRNNPTSFTRVVIQIMRKIFLTGVMSPQQLTSSVVLLFVGEPRNNPRHTESFPMQKQEQFTQTY